MESPLIVGSDTWVDLRRSVESRDANCRAWLSRVRGWTAAVPSGSRAITLLDRAELKPLRPTQDPRTYVSWGTYFWSNPATADGLPLVHLDGEVGPEVLAYDRPVTEQAFTEMIWLASRAYLREDDQALGRLRAMLEAWFMDERTAMRPHLQHAQIVPGTEEAEGRPVGTIDFNYHIPRLLETLCLVWHRLGASCRDGVTAWFHAFLDWLVEGEYADWLQLPERNNIGTYYDILVGSIAIHFGCHAIAKQRLTRFVQDRVLQQVEPDGSMPAELRRTRSLSYCVMNLTGLMQAGLLCEHVGIDVLSPKTESGGRLRKTLAGVLPAVMGETQWPHQQIHPVCKEAAVMLAALAERCFGEQGLLERATGAVCVSRFPGLPAAELIPTDYLPIGAWRGPSEAYTPDSLPEGSCP
ncbi:MAG: alginate lyase family protein [Planctomycetota bacterium]